MHNWILKGEDSYRVQTTSGHVLTRDGTIDSLVAKIKTLQSNGVVAFIQEFLLQATQQH